MSSELSGEDVEDLLAHPPALGERREREVVGVHLAEPWRDRNTMITSPLSFPSWGMHALPYVSCTFMCTRKVPGVPQGRGHLMV